MSNNDSIDEETKRILAEVEADVQSGSNDSKESKPQMDKRVKEVIKSKDGWDEYVVNDEQDEEDSQW